ncbi:MULTISPECIES: YncE family protein [Gluconacetobacter]|nr:MULTISPECIES: hypothetical protein [Gluconacetobacter]
MKRGLKSIGWGFVAGMVAACACAAPAARAGDLPGPDGNYDYAAFDRGTGHLYVARATSVTDYDLKNGKAAVSIGQIQHGHAVLPLKGRTDLLVTSGDDDTVRFIDRTDGHETGRVAVGRKPDGAVIDERHGRAFVMNAKGGTVSVIDLASREVTATVTLKPGLEFPALGQDGTLYVNNEDANEIETVDTAAMAAGPAIALGACAGPSGLAYDKASDRLIAACANGKAAIVSAGRKTLEGLVAIGGGPDAVILDAMRRRAYIPCGASGELDQISLAGAGVPGGVKRIPTETGARTGALDARTGTLYLPAARFSPPAPGQAHGAMIPGSFHVLVVRAG